MLREAISIKRLTSQRYEKYFMPEYGNGQAAHGGFIATLFAEVARVHFNEPESPKQKSLQPLTLHHLHVEYLRPVAIGQTGIFEVEDIRKGAITSLVHIKLIQDNKIRALSYVSYGHDRSSKASVVARSPEVEAMRTQPIPQIVIQDQDNIHDDKWIRCRIQHDPYSRVRTHFDYVLQRNSSLYSTSVAEWIAPKSLEDRMTTEFIGIISDLWPHLPDNFTSNRETPSPYSAAGMVKLMQELENSGSPDMLMKGISLTQQQADDWVVAWYPTMTLDLQIHKSLPAEGTRWLFQEARTEQLTSQRMDVQLRIGDIHGDLVAVGQLSVLAVTIERNNGRKDRL